MAGMPSGTVSFLFTDVEGSSQLWDAQPEAMTVALARHDEILRDAVTSHDGHVVKMTGDGVHAAFATAHEAVVAAVDAQRALANEDFGEASALLVRMGIHTGPAETRDGDYYGSAVNRAARLTSAAHGGQIVVSLATEELVRDVLCDRVALEDLGEHGLVGLSRPERVFGVTAPGLRTAFPPLRSLGAHPTNLPVGVSSFVGRVHEMKKVRAALSQSPVVTLTGVGGVGKTRLALEVAAETVAEYPDGAWLCELASVTDPDAVGATLASALGVQPSPGRDIAELVLDYLAARRLLLVLDNCEHLLDAVARLVDAVERRCSGVVVLATSREGLGVAGEQIVAVPSLDVPADDADRAAITGSESVRLFCNRARSAKSDFVLSDRNAAAVGVVCRRLDGIPLAIELAAARVPSLAPEDIVHRLDQRFRLLIRGSRASLERHQTLRATIDWSYDLLDDAERHALNALSVFAGGCDLRAAEAVVGAKDLDALDVVDVLGRLVDKSLVVADGNDHGVRYRLLETIQQYAGERLEGSSEASAVRHRHADYFVSLAEASATRLRSGEQLECAQALARDTDNFRAAFEWSIEEHSIDHAMRLIAPLAVHGVAIGYSAMDWADTTSGMSGAERHPLFPEVASWAMRSATYRGDVERARVLADRAEAAQVARGARSAAACRGPATLAYWTGDPEVARQRAEEWVALARASRDPYELSQALTHLGMVCNSAGDSEVALAANEEAVKAARDSGLSSVLGGALCSTAMLLSPHDTDRMRAVLDEAIDVGTRIGDRHAVAAATSLDGWLAAWHGDSFGALQRARECVDQLVEFNISVDNFGGPPFALAALALVDLGRLEPAAVLLGRFDADHAIRPPSWAEDVLAARLATLVETVEPQEYETLLARGANLTAEDAVACLHTLIDQAVEETDGERRSAG